MADDDNVATSCFNETFNLTVYSTPFKCSKVEVNASTCLPLQSGSEIQTIQTLCDAADVVWVVGFWFSLITGIVGNGLAILTIASLPRSPATFFVGLLAASDLVGICIQAMVHFFDKYRMYNRMSTYWVLFPMLFDISASYSNWLLVLICLERYFTIRFPLYKRCYFTLKHARVCAVVLALAIFSVYNIATWTLGYENMEMYKIRNMVYAGLPLALILVIIALISYQLRRIHRDRKSLSGGLYSRGSVPAIEELQSSRSNSRRRSSTPLQEIARLENSITVMMLVAAVCFSLLTIPICVLLYTYLDSAVSWNTPVLRAQWHLFQKICQVFTFLNLSINFVLYFLTAKKFRSQLFKVISKRSISFGRRHSRHNPALNNNSKTDNSHNVIYVDYMVYRATSDKVYNHAHKLMFKNVDMKSLPLATLPACSLIEAMSAETVHDDSCESRSVLKSESNGNAY